MKPGWKKVLNSILGEIAS